MSSARNPVPPSPTAAAGALLLVKGLRGTGIECENLRLEAGQCVVVSGPSGAGKTLLLRAIADLDPAQGRFELEGVPRQRIAAPRWRRQVMLVPAEPAWWAVQVLEHFLEPPAAELLSRLGFADETLDWAIDRLSTGERQRLALARALVLKPRVLLLDEPTSALDDAAKGCVEAVLDEFLKAGGAILMTSHDGEQIKRMARRRIQVEAGCATEVAG